MVIKWNWYAVSTIKISSRNFLLFNTNLALNKLRKLIKGLFVLRSIDTDSVDVDLALKLVISANKHKTNSCHYNY